MNKILAGFWLGACMLSVVPAIAQDIPSPEQIIADNDKNGDKAMDKAEWAASPAPIPFPEEFDTNKDGKIDLAELQAMFNSFFQGGGAPAPASTPAAAPPAPNQG